MTTMNNFEYYPVENYDDPINAIPAIAWEGDENFETYFMMLGAWLHNQMPSSVYRVENKTSAFDRTVYEVVYVDRDTQKSIDIVGYVHTFVE